MARNPSGGGVALALALLAGGGLALAAFFRKPPQTHGNGTDTTTCPVAVVTDAQCADLRDAWSSWRLAGGDGTWPAFVAHMRALGKTWIPTTTRQAMTTAQIDTWARFTPVPPPPAAGCPAGCWAGRDGTCYRTCTETTALVPCGEACPPSPCPQGCFRPGAGRDCAKYCPGYADTLYPCANVCPAPPCPSGCEQVNGVCRKRCLMQWVACGGACPEDCPVGWLPNNAIIGSDTWPSNPALYVFGAGDCRKWHLRSETALNRALTTLGKSWGDIVFLDEATLSAIPDGGVWG